MVVSEDPRHLRDVLARWDVVAREWGLDERERSDVLGGFRGGVVDDIATYRTAEAETRMRLVVELAPLLVRVHGRRERVRVWLRRPNPNLGGGTPLELMAASPEWIRWLLRSTGIGA